MPNFLNKKISGFFLVLILLAIWEVLSRTKQVNPIFLPPVTKVFLTFGTLLINYRIWIEISATLGRCFSGYIIACLIGIPIGIFMGRSVKFFNLLEPLVEILRPIPSAAIIPVAILFLGIENTMKIFVIVFACLWPILINTMDGVKSIDRVLIETGKTFRLTKTQFLIKIIIPGSSPSIITGMRISLAISLILAITVEMIAGNNGIGFFILDSERSFKFPQMYSAIILVGILGYLINLFFLRSTDRILRWHKGFTAALI